MVFFVYGGPKLSFRKVFCDKIVGLTLAEPIGVGILYFPEHALLMKFCLMYNRYS